MSPVAFGVHCEGFDCSFIQMKVIEDGIYLATTLRKFKLPKNTSSLLDVPRVVECFEYMLDELQKLQSRYKKPEIS
ncbi:hypothetical protein G6F43_012773 [Rhizopus delemar]|nr:hypothetical protein G6F43_012773 [Rhizopus delemar]